MNLYSSFQIAKTKCDVVEVTVHILHVCILSSAVGTKTDNHYLCWQQYCWDVVHKKVI